MQRSALLGSVASSALLLGAVPALGQDVPEAEFGVSADVASVDEGAIIVTATKREQSLKDVPVSISVTSGETIERAHIRDPMDLQSVVPSLRVNQLQSPGNTNFYIRGFGNGANNAGIEPSVGLFIDGVYRSRSAAMIGDFPDVERIEVLRGPQSTLFGKNASAGVISVVTTKPQFDFGGKLEASYGNYDAIVLKGTVTGPLSDTIAASLSAGLNQRDGIIHDLASDTRTNERDRWFARGQLLFAPDDDLEVRLIGDYSKIDETCCAAVNLRPSAATLAIRALGGQVNSPDEKYDGIAYFNFPSTNRIENWGFSGQVDYDIGDASLTSITAWRRLDTVTNQDSDFTSADLLQRNWQDLRVDTFTQELRATFDIGDRLSGLIGGYYFNEKIDQANEVQYGTAFRPYADLLIQGQTGGAVSVPYLEGLFGTLSGDPAFFAGRFFARGQGLDEGYRLKDESWSLFAQGDFRVTDRLTLTAGINYTHDRKKFSTDVTSSDVFAGVPLPQMVAGATAAGISQTVGGLLNVPGGFASPAEIAGFASTQPQVLQQVVAGVNAQTQPLLALSALQIFPPFMNVPNAVEPGRVSDGDFSYTARLSYSATDKINLYLGYATGYKAASVNLSRDSRPTPADLGAINAAGIGVTNLTAGSRYASPEDSTLYEAGLKADWGLVTANLAVFKQTIKNFQSNIFTGTGFFLANAGKQSVFGIEFEGAARPADPLLISLALTYLDPKYDSFELSAFGDASGTTPAGFSPLSVTFGAEWTQQLGNGDRLILRGDYYYEAPFQLVEGLPGLVQRDPATGQIVSVDAALAAAREFQQDINEVNASLTWAMENGLELSAWGRNLIDNRTILQIFDSPAQSGSISGYPNQPRTYGVAARYRF